MNYLNQIITGDCRELSKGIPDKSINLIFTDPPYIKKFMYLYDWLSDEGIRVLKDDGFLMCYAGIYWKSQVFKTMERNFEYFWDFVLLDSGNSAIMWQRKIISRYKSILCFRKSSFNALPHTNVLSSWVGGGEDKRFHIWGQDESSARYYIDCFSKPGNTVFDPFCGGGTVPAVCKMLNRNYISFEIETDVADRARQRLSESQGYMCFEKSANLPLPLGLTE